MIRALLDTNVVVSAFLWGGAPQRIITHVTEGEGILLSSEALLAELTRTLAKPKLQTYIVARETSPALIVQQYTKLVHLAEPAKIPSDAVRDADDVIVLAAAVGGRASHLVSGDKDLLTLERYADIPILSPGDFLRVLLPDENNG